MSRFATERFRNLPAEKQKHIFDAAIYEFSEHGYDNANTNCIARAADISVGSLFSYFENKQQLFLAIIELGAKKIETHIQSVLSQDVSTEEKFKNLLYMILRTSREERPLVRLYQELSAIGNQEMTSPLALRLESYAARAYEHLFEEGVRRGEVRSDLHVRMAAFHLDNIFVSMQFAYACDYYEERYRYYVSQDILHKDCDHFVVEETMKMLRGAFLTSNCEKGD